MCQVLGLRLDGMTTGRLAGPGQLAGIGRGIWAVGTPPGAPTLGCGVGIGMAVCTNGYQGLKPGLVTGVIGIRRGLCTLRVHGPTGAIGTCTQHLGGLGCGLGAGIGTAGSTNKEHLCTNGAARRLFGHQELMCGLGMVPSGNMVSLTPIGAVLFPRGSGPDGNGFLAHSCMNLALGNGIMSEGAGRLTAVVGYGYGTDHGGNMATTCGVHGDLVGDLTCSDGSGLKYGDGITRAVGGT